MSPSTSKHPFTLPAVVVALGLLASLGLGACSKSTQLTDPLAGPAREAGQSFAAGGAGKGHHQPLPDGPTLAAPADGATGVDVAPTLSWNASAGALTYRLQVSADAGFAGTVVDMAGIKTTSTAISGLAGNTVYFWRVSARNPAGPSAFTDAFSFTTGAAPPPPPPPAAPAPPSLSTPVDGATGIALNPTLVWNASTGADTYRLQVSTSSTFASTLVNQSGIAATSSGISGLVAGTQYFWRVSATNAGGTSAFSTPFSFTTAVGLPPPPPPAAPAPPALSTPSNGATGVATNPTLSWIASTGADSYRLQVSTSATFGTTVFNQGGLTATSASVPGLLAGTQYFWRVNAANVGGTSAFSTVFSFTTAAPAPPPPSTDPCASLTGLGGNVVAVSALIPQFRAARLRMEVTGDVTAGTINTLGACTASATPAVQFLSGTGIATLSGSGTPVTATGGTLTFGPLLFPAGLEAGTVLATDAAGNVLQIIWPALAGLAPGPPILRLQLASFSAGVQTGVTLDVTMTFTARAPDGTVATFTAHGANMVVPALR